MGWLALLSFALEVVIVGYTIAIARRQKWLATLFAGLIEPMKLLAILLVVDSLDRYISVLVVTLATMTGCLFTMYISEQWRAKR